jgi:hypothetical protein
MNVPTRNAAWSATIDLGAHGLVGFVYDERRNTVDFIVGATSLDEIYDALGEYLEWPKETAAAHIT